MPRIRRSEDGFFRVAPTAGSGRSPRPKSLYHSDSKGSLNQRYGRGGGRPFGRGLLPAWHESGRIWAQAPPCHGAVAPGSGTETRGRRCHMHRPSRIALALSRATLATAARSRISVRRPVDGAHLAAGGARRL